LPDLSHPGYRKLDRRGRTVVRKLAALLRVADAFDREHLGKVADVAVRLTPGKIALRAVPSPERGSTPTWPSSAGRRCARPT
jgi:exopolyphosphatase/guanosine-5'-triphosphate,3'-diphosphate pyrophosphatase